MHVSMHPSIHPSTHTHTWHTHDMTEIRVNMTRVFIFWKLLWIHYTSISKLCGGINSVWVCVVGGGGGYYVVVQFGCLFQWEWDEFNFLPASAFNFGHSPNSLLIQNVCFLPLGLGIFQKIIKLSIDCVTSDKMDAIFLTCQNFTFLDGGYK